MDIVECISLLLLLWFALLDGFEVDVLKLES